MPLLSAAKFTLALDDLVEPSTAANRPAPPSHSFHFAKPQGAEADFDKHFFLDNGWTYKHKRDPLMVRLPNGKKIDVSDHKVRYIRLFRLKLRDRYYITPWVTVPFRVMTGISSPIARTGPTPSDPTEIRLTVKPYSIYEDAISPLTKQRITEAFQTSSSPPQLKLVPEKPAIVDAVWATPANPLIDEISCISPQDVIIRICDSNNYPYQTYVDILDSNNLPVGRIYILFLEEWTHKVVFFDVTKMPMTGPGVSQLKLTMLQDSSTNAQKYLGYLNNILSRTGITFSAASPTLTDHAGTTVLCDMATPATIDTAPVDADLNDAKTRTDVILLSVYNKLIKRLPASVRQDYVFVFFAPWAAGSGSEVTTGTSRGGQRTSCIFVPKEGTICHEVCHALGLVHTFYAMNDAEIPTVRGNIISQSTGSLAALNVSKESEFFTLNDNMNLANSCSVFDMQPDGTPGGVLVNPTTVQWHYHYFVIDREPVFSTHNLMDYQKADQISKYNRIELGKHQIELIRYMVFNKFDLINVI